MSAYTQKALTKSRATTPIRKRNMYRTRSFSSDVDETLFGSPARHVAQKDTLRINPDDVSWDPPWVTSPRKDGSPLLWTPYDGKGMTLLHWYALDFTLLNFSHVADICMK